MGKPEMKKRFKGKDYPLTGKKARKERGWNGFAESDTWSFDSYLAQVIPEGLKRIRAFPGHPGEMTEEEWWQVLDQIIEGFAVFDELACGWPKAQHAQKLELKFNRAMLLFTRHFFNFWT